MIARRRRACVTAMAALGVLVVNVRAGAAQTTFNRDVAPLLFTHCAVCHHPGGSSVVPLLTYQGARQHARQIMQLTETGQMPPWQPAGEHGIFVGDRRLSSSQIAVFKRWLEEGLVEGDPSTLPEPPAFSDGWQLGTPDLVLTMPAYRLRADGPDLFRNFVLPVPLSAMKYVRAWEFRPGNARVVHHATMQVDDSGASSRYDDADPEPGYEGLIAPHARTPDGFFLDWAPGHRPNVAVEGTAWPLPAASELVMMLHLRPSGKEEDVRASVAFYFSDTPPARLPVMIRLTRQDMAIPAGTTGYVTRDRYVVPADIELRAVQPHAHYLARQIEAAATLPDGRRLPLLRIDDWDFNWQDVYHYANPIRLPAGTALEMTIAYDNSSGNPRNPNHPPIDVDYGQQTNDEMAEVWFQALTVKPGDRGLLVDSIRRKVLPEEIKGRMTLLRRQPSNIALRDDLALMLADAGDLAGAEREFRATLALDPQSAAAHFNVGFAVLAQGRRDEARPHFESALRLEPAHAPSHFQLGLLAQASGNIEAAYRHLSTAVDGRPDDPEVLLAAGVAAVLKGEMPRGVPWLTRALDLRPQWPNAQAALASALSMQPAMSDRTRAVTLAESAVAATGRRNGAFLDILSEALAQSGQMARAVAVAREAQRVAANAGDRDAADRIGARLRQWETER